MEPATTISVKEVADLLLEARGRIDFYWNFYIAVVIAVIGWLMSRKLPLTRSMKILVSITYAIAAIMNVLGLYNAYTFAEALRVDLLRIEGTAVLEETRRLLGGHSYLPLRQVAMAVHLVVGGITLFVVWFARLPVSEPTAGLIDRRTSVQSNSSEPSSGP